MRMDATGSVICQTSITEQGQGSESLTAQIVGSVLGVPMDRVRVILGDTDNTPYGGGTWASRGAGIGGEAALQAAKVLREQYPRCRRRDPAIPAGRARYRQPSDRQCQRRRGPDRTERTGADRLFPPRHAAAGHPAGADGDPAFRAEEYPFAFTNGVQASWLEVDTDTGFVNCCGTGWSRIAGPSSTRNWSTSRSGAGWCRASAPPCSRNASMTSAASSPTPIWPTIWFRCPAKCPISTSAMWCRRPPRPNWAPRAPARRAPPGAAAAVSNAVNDALRPFGAIITEIPLTPQIILTALGRI